jgi:hypothetical protein
VPNPEVNRKALVVGISRYGSNDFDDLECCVDDARAMAQRLAQHADGRDNHQVRLLVSDAGGVNLSLLQNAIDELLGAGADCEALFYFSGHGWLAGDDAYLVTEEGTQAAPGYPMGRLLEAANRSGLRSVLVILDCCHSGSIGNFSGTDGKPRVRIAPNVSVLAASAAYEKSTQGLEYSLFTQLLLEGMDGGAADLRGKVHAGALYGFVEQALADWEQCPVYKCYSRRLNLVRECGPQISDVLLARLPEWFAYPEQALQAADVEAAALEPLRSTGLVSVSPDDEGTLSLTPRGRLYWTQAQRGDFVAQGAT